MASAAMQQKIAEILTALPNQISSVFVQNTNYPIKDSQARSAISSIAISVDQNTSDIASLFNIVDGGVHYLGKTTTPLTDGATTNPITIDGQPVTIDTAGSLVIYEPTGKQPEEYIWDGSKWNALGSTNGLGNLAFSDQVSAAYTPSGTVSITATTDQSANVSAIFTGSPVAVDAKVDIPGQTIDTTLSGTSAIIQSTFVGKESSLNITPFTPSGDVSVQMASASGTVGSVVKSVSPSSGTIGSSQYDSSTETLSIIFGSALTSVGETTGSPSFSLDSMTFTTGFSGKEISATGTFTPEALAVSASYTPAGSVKVEVQPKNNISVLVDDVTPEGTISGYVPIAGHTHTAGFTGNAATITGNPVPKA